MCDFLSHTITVAERGTREVSPNPKVGAVLVHENRIIGEGWHQKYGEEHAEVNCLRSVRIEDQSTIAESTLYVSLEPCCFHGKTPACTDLILKHGIKKVVIGCLDPFPKVAGRGVQILREAGVDVTVSSNQKKYNQLIQPFFIQQIKKRPYIILKWAQTKDGYISKKGEQTQISEPWAQVLTHQWRSEVDGVMIGTNTAEIDNPRLNNRWSNDPQPARIVIDNDHRLDSGLHLFDGSMTIYVISNKEPKGQSNADYIILQEEDWWTGFFEKMMERGLYTIMVEGGAKLLRSFIKADMWDEARTLTTNWSLKEGIRAPTVKGRIRRSSQIGDDYVQIIANATYNR